MKPSVERNTWALYNADCLEVLPGLSDKSVDMVLCDLPYGVTQNPRDIPLPLDKLWVEYKRILKDNGVCALFGQGVFFADLIQSNRAWYRYDLVWDKVLTSGFLNANRMPLRRHEQIAVFYRRLPTYHPQFTQGTPLHSKGSAYKTKTPTNHNYGSFNHTDDSRAGSTEKYPTSILTFKKPHPSASVHPTEKPVELLEWLIHTYTNEGDVVLDNCMGSGSTGVSCIRSGRKFIGVEVDNNTFKIAEQRIWRAENES